MGDNKCSGFGTYVNYCECLLQRINELNVLLTGMISSYRLLVGSAEEFNRITLAHKGDLEDAIDRADDLGDIIDKLICRMDVLVKIYLDICFQAIMCPDVPPKQEVVPQVPRDLEPELVLNLQQSGALEQIQPVIEPE